MACLRSLSAFAMKPVLTPQGSPPRNVGTTLVTVTAGPPREGAWEGGGTRRQTLMSTQSTGGAQPCTCRARWTPSCIHGHSALIAFGMELDT